MDKQVIIVTNGKQFKAFSGAKRSGLITLDREETGGNPYSIYGNHCEKWLGIDKFHLSFTVARVEQGEL